MHAGADRRRHICARDRPRGAPADQARPLLGADQGRDRARVLESRRALLRPRLRRRRAPGHRPDLGRDADPRGLARDPALRLQLPLRRPRPEPDAGADRRARARAPRPRAEAVLGAVREVRAPRRDLRGASHDRQVLGEGRGRRRARRDEEPGRRQGGELEAEHAQAADAAEHDRVHDRRLLAARDHARRRDADRRGPLHGRVHLLPAHRQHGLPEVAEHEGARHRARPDPRVLGRQGPARRAASSPPAARRRRPTTRRSTRPRRSTRARSRARSGASTSSSSVASSPPSRRR